MFGVNRRSLLRSSVLAIATAAVALGGCQNSAEKQGQEAVVAYFEGDYNRSRVLLEPLAKETNGDFVLNNARLGSASIAGNDKTVAETAFLRSYEVINSVGVNNGGRGLGAAVIDEKIKIWKGEPYERAMVNYYLGCLYYMDHDYNNARAAFENALFKLRDYGNDDDKKDNYTEIESDFTLAYVMLGKSWQRLGEPEKAQQMFDRAVQLRPDLADLANFDYNQHANVLLIVDWGNGPIKVTRGDGSFVGIGPKPRQAGPIYLPSITVDGQYLEPQPHVRPPVDLLALAQDRRWQDIDTIRVIKSITGEGLMGAGAIEGMQGGRNNAEIGAALFVGGLLLKLSSAPDLRCWEMLPRTSFVIPLQIPPGVHDITVEFTRGGRLTISKIVAPAQGDNTYYLRMSPFFQREVLYPNGYDPDE